MNRDKEKMKPGDVLVYFGKLDGSKEYTPSHVALAFDERYILHNTIAGGSKFAGVVKHKGDIAVKSMINKGVVIRVFRLEKEEQLAASAAKFGEHWAAPKIVDAGNDLRRVGDREYKSHKDFTKREEDYKDLTHAMNPFMATPEDSLKFLVDFKTSRSPYSVGRLEKGQTSDPQSWSLLSAFRAVKAVVRARTEQGLSPRHGTSCDQFVMYCYQAASVQKLIGDRLNDEIIDLVSKRAHDIKLYLTENQGSQDLGMDQATLKGPVWERLHSLLMELTGDGFKTGFLPQELTGDAKTSSVAKLLEKIQAEDSGFRQIGILNVDAVIVQETRKEEKEEKT